MAERLSRRRLLSLGAAGLTVVTQGCRRGALAGHDPVPPGTRLIPGVFRDLSPRWSPDGRQIAFLRQTTDRNYQLHVVGRDLRNPRPLVSPALANPDRPIHVSRTSYVAPDGIAWSPDGTKIAFPRVEWFDFESGERVPGTGIWAYDLRGGPVYPLALHPPKYREDFYTFRSPTWSPDGTRLAFVGEAPDGATALHFRFMTQPGAVVDSPRADYYDDADWPAWSPDGRHLVFRQGLLRASTADAVETLRLISPGGTEARNLLSLTPDQFLRAFHSGSALDFHPAPRIASPTWSPDGSRIAFSLTSDAADRNRNAVYVLDSGSSRPPARVSPPDGHGYHVPVWLSADRLGALRTARRSWDLVEFDLVRANAITGVGQLTTDDFDWAPGQRELLHARSDEVRRSDPATASLAILFVQQ